MNGREEILQNLIGLNNTDKASVLEEILSLSSSFSDAEMPYLDRSVLEYATLSDIQKQWRTDGVVVLESFIPDDLIEDYTNDWVQHNQINHDRPMGYPGECAYYQVGSLMRVATYGPLHDVISGLIGDDMGIHLNLTGWKSTQRNWHQDGYLNPDSNRDHYVAVWVALDDIDEDSGPFEFVRGSHMLPMITQEKTLSRLELSERSDPMWPKYSERFLTPMFEKLIEDCGFEVERFLAKKGDVLVWHARLMHRGSAPVNPDLWRKSVILHYSGVNHRPDMPKAVQADSGGWFFPINQKIPL